MLFNGLECFCGIPIHNFSAVPYVLCVFMEILSHIYGEFVLDRLQHQLGSMT